MRIIDLTKTYKPKKDQDSHVEALKGVSFDLPDRGMVFVLGKSGSGKSTLLNVLSGLDSFDDGDVIFKGKSLKSLTKAELDSYRNSCCGFIFQEYNLIPELNVHDNIALAVEMQGEKDVDKKILEALKSVGLEGYAGRKVNELSGGQKQRVAIARSIVKNPQIIFADEPSGALDSKTGASIFELLKELSKDKLIIVVSHDREFAEKYGDRIIELADGKIVKDTNIEYKENESKDTYKTQPSKMPLRSVLKIGCSNFKFHPIRLVATILLAVFSFTFFGLALVFSTFNKVNPFVKAVYDRGYEFLAVRKYESYRAYDGFDLDNLLLIADYGYKLTPVTEKDIEKLQSYISEELMIVIRKCNYMSNYYAKEWNDDFNRFRDESEEYITSSYNGYMTLTEEMIERYNFELIGDLPKSSNEVVINEQNYNIFKYLGYKNKNEDGNEYEINSPKDIIGHTINIGYYENPRFLTITGVLKTGCNKACHETNHLETQEVREDGNLKTPTFTNSPEYFTLDNEYLFHEKLFVSQELLISLISGSLIDDTYILLPVPQSKKEFKAIVRFIVNYNNQGINKAGVFYKFSEENPTSEWYNGALYTSQPLSVMALYIGIIFFIFTAVFMLNFITSSIRSQMKQIGIVSALGADFKQLYKIYAISAMIVCGIVYILTLIPVGIGVGWLNSMGWDDLWFNMNGWPFKILSLNFATIVILLAVSMATALLGALISLRKMRKLSPAEIIRRGMIK